MSTTFLRALLDGGIENPNYFNGKVLTARDLRDEQGANRARARRLGQAIGEGIFGGLFVERAGDDLRVTAGGAINRLGDVLLLPAEQTLPLNPTTPVAAAIDSPFGPCGAVASLDPLASGIYLLALTLASELSGERATHSGLNGENPTCVSRYEVQGVQFKVLAIDAQAFPISGDERLYRGKLAAACFGLTATTGAAADPFAAPATYGLADALRQRGHLADCDVPLAVFRYQDRVLRFVDSWAVRRGCVGLRTGWPLAETASEPALLLPQHSSTRREIEARALLLQFQAHLADLAGPNTEPNTVKAHEHFTFLPAAGYLPTLPDAGESAGRRLFVWQTFFGTDDLPVRDLDPAFLRGAFAASFAVEPIPLTPGQPPPVELLRVPGAPADQPYLVFLRREPLTVVAPEPPAPEPTPDAEPGELIVGIVDRAGRTLRAEDVAGVSAAPVGGGKAAEGRWVGGGSGPGDILSDNGKRYMRDQRGKAAAISYQQAYLRAIARPDDTVDVGTTMRRRVAYEVADAERQQRVKLMPGDAAIYRFALPPGNYIVTVRPVAHFARGSGRATVRAGATTTLAITLHTIFVEDPPARNPLDLDGRHYEEIYIDPLWKKKILPDPPPDWQIAMPPGLREEVEVILGDWLEADPQIVTSNPTLFVNPAYRAGGTPAEQPYAYIGTADGRYHPAILVGGEHALGGNVPASRGGLADLDESVVAATRGTSLANLGALTGAWAGLLGDTLGLSPAGARSLIEEARGAATRLQGSFERYPGVDGAVDAALKANFADDVALANASPQEIFDRLQADDATTGRYSLGFATRLVERARVQVAPAAWSLDALGLDAAGRHALNERGIATLGALIERGQGDEAAAVREALGRDEATFAGLLDAARGAMLGERLAARPDAGVAAVPGVTTEQVRLLTAGGITTAAGLAAADEATLAATLGVEAEVARGLIGSAAEARGELTALQQTFNLDEQAIGALRERDLGAIGLLANAGEEQLAAAVGERAVAIQRIAALARNRFG